MATLAELLESEHIRVLGLPRDLIDDIIMQLPASSPLTVGRLLIAGPNIVDDSETLGRILDAYIPWAKQKAKELGFSKQTALNHVDQIIKRTVKIFRHHHPDTSMLPIHYSVVATIDDKQLRQRRAAQVRSERRQQAARLENERQWQAQSQLEDERWLERQANRTDWLENLI